MTNTTTYFFREARALRALVSVLPQRGAHVWIVGCSTGDELYSLAILATEAGCHLDITASDVNATALGAAAAGRYRGRNLRLLDACRVEHYFDRVGDDMFAVRPDRLPNVRWRFVLHDIARDAALAPFEVMRFDAVICRHVLVYLDENESLRALGSITANLRDRGHVLLAGSEWLGRHSSDESLARRAGLELTMLAQRHDEEPVLAYRRLGSESAAPHSGVPATRPTRPVPRAPTPPVSAPESHWLACASGDRALDSGDIERALAHYQLAEAIRADAPEIQLRLGLAHMIAGNSRLACQALERLVAQRPSWPGLLLLGDLMSASDGRKAADYYRRALTELQRSSATPPELGALEAFWPDRATLVDMLAHKSPSIT